MTVTDIGGALDLVSVASHVAMMLDRVAPAALSIGDLAAGYRHPIPSDVTRVKHYAKVDTEAEANIWMVTAVVREMKTRGKRGAYQLTVVGDRVALVDGFTIENIHFRGKRVYAVQNPHEQLHDVFNPMTLTGIWSRTWRRSMGSLDELRESLREFGWMEESPAIKDERGVVLVGARRLKLAEELGIKPVIHTVRYGNGDEADIRRCRTMIASNIGVKSPTPDEKKDWAESIIGEREWNLARIGAVIGAEPIAEDEPETIVVDVEPAEPRPGTQWRRILDALRDVYPEGLTDEELQVLLGMKGNTERPRRGELERDGWVEETNERRDGSIVWRATIKAMEVHEVRTGIVAVIRAYRDSRSTS